MIFQNVKEIKKTLLPQICFEGIKKIQALVGFKVTERPKTLKSNKGSCVKCLRPLWLKDVGGFFMLAEHICGRSVSFPSFHFNSCGIETTAGSFGDFPLILRHMSLLHAQEWNLTSCCVRLGPRSLAHTGNIWWKSNLRLKKICSKVYWFLFPLL